MGTPFFQPEIGPIPSNINEIGLLNADDSLSFARKIQFTAGGSQANFVIPSGVRFALFKLWGAGGAAAQATNSAGGAKGGPGGYIEAVLPVVGGQTVTYYVGEGGNGRSDSAGGGKESVGGSGGGFTALRIGSVWYLIAGAGGGGGGNNEGAGSPSIQWNTFHGGVGGGDIGGQGSSGGVPSIATIGGNGGTQLAGGSINHVGPDTAPTAGSALNGGDGSWDLGETSAGPRRGFGGSAQVAGATPAAYAFNSTGGGGGAGWYGGAGGGADSGSTGNPRAGGGGGSSYAIDDAEVRKNLQGTVGNIAAPNNSDEDYIAGVGEGGSNSAGGSDGSGGNGLFVMRY